MNDSGILLINKEKGITSSDVVVKLRKILKTKKIGHTGTLDPLAEGLLVITINKATKISSLLTKSYKEYIATMKLGIKTDTFDIEGKVLEEKEVPKDLEIEKVIKSFQKTYSQQVPIFSAVKINGKKLYEYARQNEEITPPVKDVDIKEIEVLSINDDIIKFRCLVSSGTYIRSLINDIGEELGVFATMTELIRTKVNKFSLDDAYTLEDVTLGNYKLISIEDSLDIPKIKVDEELEFKIKNGNKLDNIFNIDDKVIFINSNDELLGIYEKNDDNKLKVFRNF